MVGDTSDRSCVLLDKKSPGAACSQNKTNERSATRGKVEAFPWNLKITIFFFHINSKLIGWRSCFVLEQDTEKQSYHSN